MASWIMRAYCHRVRGGECLLLSRELLERFMEPFKLLGTKCAEGTEGVINARKRRPIGSDIEVRCARGNKLVRGVSISLGL